MYDLLELLYDYSVTSKRADRNFIEHILSFYLESPNDYLKRIRYGRLDKDIKDPNRYCAMAYSYYDKEIIVNEDAINEDFTRKMLNFQMLGYDEFEKFLLYNSEILYYLLHEIAHSMQYKKAFLNDGSFESSVLNLCFYPEIEILRQSTLNLALIIVSEKLFHHSSKVIMLNDLKDLNNGFDRDVPYERLAAIDASKQLLGLLEVFNTFIKDIPLVVNRYKRVLLNQYMVGYSNSKEAPLIHYINEVRRLNISKLNSLVTNLENRFDEIAIIDERMKFGLDVKKDDLDNFQKRILK